MSGVKPAQSAEIGLVDAKPKDPQANNYLEELTSPESLGANLSIASFTLFHSWVFLI